MNADRSVALTLRIYILLAFVFIFTPIVASFIFSFNSDTKDVSKWLWEIGRLISTVLG